MLSRTLQGQIQVISNLIILNFEVEYIQTGSQFEVFYFLKMLEIPGSICMKKATNFSR